MFYLLICLAWGALQQSPPRPSAEYVVGAQDKLAVAVFGEADLTRTITVDADGTFDFPLIGRVKAAGLTVRAIEQDLTRRLKNGLYVNPQVSIEIAEYRSQVVYVTGSVRTPGAVSLTGNLSVMEALSRAGSPTPEAGSYIVINRRHASEGEQAQRVSMVDLQSGRAQQIMLADGDTIYVPKAETFYVTGYVKNPGPYLLGAEMTVAQAISLAGGVTERGSKSRVRITRTIDGKQVVLKDVKLADRVQPGDSVEVLPRFF
jgi:polysaccharide export outer membrane protein